MKSILVLFLAILPFIILAQIPIAKPIVYTLNQANNSFENPMVDYKSYFAKASIYDLQIYNSSVGLLENYTFVSERQYNRKDEFSLLNRTRYSLNFNSASVTIPLNNIRIDSFNPYGSTSITQSVGLGLLNTFLNLK